MKLVIGIDEAGYGPNLGPLCLGASLWLLPDDLSPLHLAKDFEPLFHPHPTPRNSPAAWIPLGDSKKIYQSGAGIADLTASLLAIKQLQAGSPIAPNALLAAIVEAENLHRLSSIPWYAEPDSGTETASSLENFECLLPEGLLEQARHLWQSLKIELVGMHALAIDERLFNQRLDQWDNKATVLTLATLEWLQALLQSYHSQFPNLTSIEVLCDKHGGRNRYHSALSQVFPEAWIAIECESSSVSRYRFRYVNTDSVWSFTAKGDAIVPTSLASMLAKWTREVFMHRLNAYWQSQLPNLKATAGYPVDAVRFSQNLQAAGLLGNMPREHWWRRA